MYWVRYADDDIAIYTTNQNITRVGFRDCSYKIYVYIYK